MNPRSRTRKERFRLFGEVLHADFIARPNRFLVRCRLAGRAVTAYLPNPGRLKELLLPGARILLVDNGEREGRKTRFTCVAVEREGIPILLHTHKTNDAARHLVDLGAIPGLEGARVVRAEVTSGRSRFDFLLDRAGEEVFLEVKSCTLVGDRVAMFPDAVTERGAKHVRELARMSREGTPTAVLFLVHWPRADIFMPDFHTDLRFAETLLDCREDVRIIAASTLWDRDLALLPESRGLHIPWETIETETRDRGSYLVLMRLARTRDLEIGQLGRVRFPGGYYIYVGSAMANLSRRVARHAKVRKKMHWHIDRFRPHANFTGALAIRASDRLECGIAGAVGALSEWSIPGFGCSDCPCPSHLFGFSGNPVERRDFYQLLAWFRMDRLAAR